MTGSTDIADQPASKVLMISSDGHVSAQMDGYRQYMPARHHDEFDAFCRIYREKGSRNFEPESMLKRLDSDVVNRWTQDVINQGRVAGLWDIKARFAETDRHGIAAEVLFPDFGLPFELYSPLLAATLGYRRTPEQVRIANSAYNRWLADFCSQAPERFAGLASISFDDVEAAIEEIKWARSAGLRGILLPMFSEEHPIFHPRYEGLWSVLEDLEMPVNCHIAASGITGHVPKVPPLPHPSVALPIFGAQLHFFCNQILSHLIWGGVLERHPKLQVVFTEQGSGWVLPMMQAMDYSWDGSYLRRDVRVVVPHRPSEYFKRQCHLGSSLFSRAEAEARNDIGVDRMTIGMDYPHHEGSWGTGPGHIEYLQATLGAALVPPDDARRMLGENAVALWGFDPPALKPIVDRVGVTLAEILKVPTEDKFVRGDVHKPLSFAF